jgi:hypothetical protein
MNGVGCQAETRQLRHAACKLGTADIRSYLWEGEKPMAQRQGGHRLLGHTALSSLLLVGLLGSMLAAAQIFGGEAERTTKGKPAAKADFVLTVKDNLISLKAKDASLKEVLEEIGRRMKVDVVAGIPDTKKITAEFENLSIEEAVSRLSTNYSYVMDSTNGKKKITKIIVLEKGKETELSTPTTKESAIKKEEKPAKPESKGREEAVRKESPPPTKQN